MSADQTTKFSFEKQITEDFMRMIRILTKVKNTLEESVALNEERKKIKDSIEFIKQDIRTLEHAKNAVLDEKVVTSMEKLIKKKREELAQKEKDKKQNREKALDILSSYKDFDFYAKSVKDFYESINRFLSINFDKLTTEEYLAFLFANISFNPVMAIEEKSSNYKEADAILSKGSEARSELWRTN